MSRDEVGILDAIADRLGMSRSQVIRNLIIYQGLCGSEMPLTRSILSLDEPDRDRVIAEIRERAESDDTATPLAFKRWVQEALGDISPEKTENGIESVFKKLASR